MKRPKNTARLFWLCRRIGSDSWFYAHCRLANCMFVWLGPVEIGWRMPWATAYLAALDTPPGSKCHLETKA